MAKKRNYTKPEPLESFKLGSQVSDYLKQERGLSDATLYSYGIVQDSRWIVFPYLKDGDPVLHKRIGLDRDEKGKKKVMVSKDSMPCLFGWNVLERHYPNTRHVVITEGEIDCMTVHQWGVPALSVPFGAGTGAKHSWIDVEWDALKRFDTIYLCMDGDEEGRKASQEIARRLGIHRCRIIDLEGWAIDPNALLMIDPESSVDGVFKGLMDEAEEVRPLEIKAPSDYREAVMELFHPSGDKPTGIQFPWPELENNFLIRPGELTLVTGINGHGKTKLMGQIALHLMNSGEPVLLASLENQPHITARDLVRQSTLVKQPAPHYIEAALDWMNEKLWLFSFTGNTNIEKVLECSRYAYQRYGVTNIIIDNLARCGVAEDDYKAQKQLVDALCDLKVETGIHVWLVVHPRKGESEAKEPDKMDIKGTGALTDMADNVMSVWRNINKIDDPESTAPDGMLGIKKQRHGEGWIGKQSLWFHPESQTFLDGSQDKPKRYINLSP